MRHQPRPHSIATIIISAIVAVTIATQSVAGAFGDVEDDQYYSDAVAWMVDEGITTGVEAGCFGPGLDVTRGQVATFLYRLDRALGNQPAAGDHPFIDVTSGYQQDPVGWMFDAGLTTGVAPGLYLPSFSITRGDFAVMLWRYAGQPGASNLSPFADIAADYQRPAVAWMAEQGITTGTSASTFSPNGTVSRAEAATFLYRFVAPTGAVTGLDSTECTLGHRAALQAGGLTAAEATCAAPHLLGFDVAYLVDVVRGSTAASLDLMIAAAAVGNECLNTSRIAALTRVFF